ncbi:MAG TPA: membrane protein insertase YidC [Gemmatimonadaceae bacterium]|jgi:YidC/Oxa1 family membrane protein insertase
MNGWLVFVDFVRALVFAAAHLCGDSLGGGILALSVVVRVALLPLTFRAARRALAHQTKLRSIAPHLAALKKKHGADRAKLGEATVAVYKEHGIEMVPRGTFTTMLVQAPIGSAIYSALGAGLKSRTAFLWVADISRPDAAVAIGAAVLAGLAAGAAPPSFNKVGVAVGTLFTLFFAWRLAASVGLYWLASNVVGVAQSVLLRFSPEAKAARLAATAAV